MSNSPRLTPTPAPRKPALPKKAAAVPGRKSSGGKEFSLTHVSPSSVTYNKKEKVLLVFNQSLPCNVEFTVSFTGLQSNKESKAKAEKIGDNVLLLTAPDHFPPEDTKLVVHHGNHFTKLCTHIRQFSFKSPLQQIQESILMVSDPVEFMCAALHLRQKTSQALDCELEKQFRKNIPPDFSLLVENTKERVDIVETASADPTLLHFAARYNLFRLALALVECPGGPRALNTANCDRLTPSDIASDCGHQQLATVLADAQQNPNKLEEIYESMNDPIYSDYFSLQTDENQGEIYVDMNAAEEDELYTKMTGFHIDEEDENIYQNADELFELNPLAEDSGYDSRAGPLGSSERSQYNQKQPGKPWDSRSIHSISSTSSSESNTSAGSGCDYALRPKMAEPRPPQVRSRLSLPEVGLGFKERAKSEKAKTVSVSNGYKTGSMGNYARRGVGVGQSVGLSNPGTYTHERYEQDDVPPPPPPKNPNIN